MEAEMKQPKVLMAMSGGVDSSVAAQILVDQGYEVIGITFSVYDYSRLNRKEGKGSCCSIEDVTDARLVCDKIGIRHYLVDSKEAFRKHVIDYFAESYKKGETPNPCMACNTFIKFDELEHYAKVMGCELYATGHYVDVVDDDGHLYLETAKDLSKDQSYFLLGVKQDFLKKCLFPLAGMSKTEVRKIAEEKELPVSKKPESMEVCFIPDNDYRGFLKKEFDIPDQSGLIVNQEGKILGSHRGIHHYTLGQRKGLGALGLDAHYVVRLDAEKNQVVVGQDRALFSEGVIFQTHQFSQHEAFLGKKLLVKIRSRSPMVGARLVELDPIHDSENAALAIFSHPQRAVTPGQFAVFYEARPEGRFRLLGGGQISRGWHSAPIPFGAEPSSKEQHLKAQHSS